MPAHSQKNRASSTGLALVGASLITLAAFLINGKPDDTPDVPSSKPSAATVDPPAVAKDVQRAVFFDQKVEPTIIEADALNREAAERCIARIETMVDKYRRGIDPFVSDLTSLSTRFGIVKRMPRDWWKKEKGVEAFVEDKFERHLFSEETLMRDITEILGEFKSEVDTNQKRMLISVKSAMNASDLPEIQANEYQPFFESVSRQLQQYSSKQGTASVQNAIGVFVISETAGTFAGRAIVVGLLARFGASAAVSTAAGAGATAGSTAVGTGAGSVGGPVGAVVGFGIGMAVGLVVDWWMTEQFETQMSGQMNDYLDKLERTILYGGATSRSSARGSGSLESQDQSGLVEALPVVCDRLLEAYRESFYEQIVTGNDES